PVAGWKNDGWPVARDARAQEEWLHELSNLLATQTARHGGPIAYVEGQVPGIDADLPPWPVTVIPVNASGALGRSREIMAGLRGAVVWTDVEGSLYPAGWGPPGAPPFRPGAVSLGGEERPAAAAVRRDAAVLRNWAALAPGLKAARAPRPAIG